MSHRKLAVSVLSLVVCASSLFADVTMKNLWRGSGYHGMGGNEGSAERVVQGVKSREDSQFKFTGKMMKFMTGGDKSGTQIIRVDQDKIVRLDLKKKTYTESSISATLEKLKEKPHAEDPKSIADYKAGRDKAFAFLVGAVMKLTRGKASPQIVNDLLRKKISEENAQE